MKKIIWFCSLAICPALYGGLQGATTHFTGRIAATYKVGGFSRSLLFTYGTNALRAEIAGSSAPNPIDIFSLAGARTIIAFPANRSFVRLNPSNRTPQLTAPMNHSPAMAPSMNIPQGSQVIGPTNLPGTPKAPKRPAMPSVPKMPVMPARSPAGMMGSMPAMPPMPMAGETWTLKATGKTTNLLGYACEKYELKQRGEAMEIWATRQLPAFHNWQPNQRPRFGPRMLEDQWGKLIRAKHLFPLLAVLKLPNGAERFRFEVKKITPQNPKKQNPALFQPPANYHEIRPLPF